jgi:hypothetical protein
LAVCGRLKIADSARKLIGSYSFLSGIAIYETIVELFSFSFARKIVFEYLAAERLELEEKRHHCLVRTCWKLRK